MELEFEVNNQELILLTDTSKIANKSNNYLKLLFDFKTEDWMDKTHYCILQNNIHKNYLFLITSEGVMVPASVLTGRYFYITVYGVDENDTRITTNVLKIRLKESDFTIDISSVSADHDVVNTILNLINSLDESISLVGKSGSYLDLLNIPETFTPSEHSHSSSEVSDFEERTASEIKHALRQTANRIRNYGA